jgi:hypothetical protein
MSPKSLSLGILVILCFFIFFVQLAFAQLRLVQTKKDVLELERVKKQADVDRSHPLVTYDDLRASVRVVQLPDEALVPEVAVDSSGNLHIVYGKGDNAFYTRSVDDGKNFELPIQLTIPEATAVIGGERGPKIAIGKDDFIHVVWLNKKEGGVGYARSVSGGKSFEIKSNLVEMVNGKRLTDSPTVTADKNGNVYIFWLDGRLPPDPNSPVSSSIFVSISSDNGKTFSANMPVKSDYPGRACACCALEAEIGTDGELYAVFRGGYQNIRDMHLLKRLYKAEGRRRKAEKEKEKELSEMNFKATLISDDRWKYEACPMSGAFLSLGPEGLTIFPLYVAWMSQGEVYYASSLDGGKSFQNKVRPKSISQIVSVSKRRNHPIVLVNPKGQVFFAWMEEAGVKWEVHSSDGSDSQLISNGDAGKISSRSKPTGFVDRDGGFVLVK